MEKFNGRPSSLSNRSQAEIRTYDFLDKLGISYTTVCHAPAATMEECQAIETELQAPICKNLFLCNRQQTQFYLLMLPGDKVFKTKYLSSQLGCARLSFADEAHMTAMLDIHPGAVSPMGLINETEGKVQLIIDQDLLTLSHIGCHPCVNTATLRLALPDLLNCFLPATNHPYRPVSLPANPD
jgi:Ala-tRNA(Pro) deacylase